MVNWAAADAIIQRTFGEEVGWRVGGHGPATTILAIFSEPDAEVTMFRQTVRVPSLVASVDASLGVAVDDTIERGVMQYIVRAVDRDVQMRMARLSLDPTA